VMRCWNGVWLACLLFSGVVKPILDMDSALLVLIFVFYRFDCTCCSPGAAGQTGCSGGCLARSTAVSGSGRCWSTTGRGRWWRAATWTGRTLTTVNIIGRGWAASCAAKWATLRPLAAHPSALRIQIAGYTLASAAGRTTPTAASARRSCAGGIGGLAKLPRAEVISTSRWTAATRGVGSLAKLAGTKIICTAPSTAWTSSPGGVSKLAGAKVVSSACIGTTPSAARTGSPGGVAKLAGAEVIGAPGGRTPATSGGGRGCIKAAGAKIVLEIAGRFFFHLVENLYDRLGGVLWKQQGFTEPVECGQHDFFHLFEKGIGPFADPIFLKSLRSLARARIYLRNIFGLILELLGNGLELFVIELGYICHV
jgi:hypothetical protein